MTDALAAPAANPTHPPAVSTLGAATPVAHDAFVHHHVHSEYSILDGLNGPSTLVRTAGNLGQPAVALTDHGRLSGVPSFLEGIAWYNKTHAERHAYDPDKCNKKPKGDEVGCHSASQCRDRERCPKGASGLVGAAGHATLSPLRGIIGIETYVAHNGRRSRVPKDTGHLILLAKNATGWANLRQLASLASTEGFYSKPRIDWELLERHHDGLIALSSCLGSHLANIWKGEGLGAPATADDAIEAELEEDLEEDDVIETPVDLAKAAEVGGGPAAADELAIKYRDLMGPGNYFFEIQWHNDQEMGGPLGTHDQADFNNYLVGASERLGIPIVMTNDLHYAVKHDAPLQEIMMNVQQKKTAEQIMAAKAAGKSVMHFDTPDFYLKSRKEMEAALSDWYRQAKIHDPQTAEILKANAAKWLEATVEIAASVEDYEPFKKGLHFPVFPVPAGHTAETFLAEEVHRRAPGRFKDYDERTQRLVDYELQCVNELGFAPYFLITADFCDYARDQNIEVGLGRGSAPGSVVTYVLSITDIDPIKWGLTAGGIGLTRFLNPTVLYRLETGMFGDLPARWATELEAPSAEEMETEVAAALNARTKERNERSNAGLDEHGNPLEAGRLEYERKRWNEEKARLVEEWRAIKSFGATNAEAKRTNPFAKDAVSERASVIEPIWRWMRAVRDGAPVGDKNECYSNLAKFLGITSVEMRVTLEDGSMRFLPKYEFTHSRKSMPDIDIDFEPGPDGREKVMRYVAAKYGEDHVCQIATFGTMLAKSAIKDVARAKGFEPLEGDELSMLVPKKFAGAAASDDTGDEDPPKVTLHEMIESDDPMVVGDPDVQTLRARMAADPRVDEVLRLAARLEGAKRGEGTHACGVLITPEPVTNYVSVRKVKEGKGKADTGAVQAVYDGPTLTDKLGLLKVDFLGLQNLSVNKMAVARILERRGEVVNWRTPPDDDPTAMGLLRDGFTEGIFQFSQPMGTGVLRRMKPRTINDLGAATALGRPGPAQYIPDFVEARSRGQKPSGDPVFDEAAKGILDDTYGILVYQEQVMLLSIKLAGFTLPESDGLRKATAKKDKALLASWRDTFVERAVARKANRAFLEHYWDQTLRPFASYSFNRSHAITYAYMAYTQAYLKAHYAPEFMAGFMTVVQGDPAKERGGAKPLVKAANEAKRMGYAMLSVDINESTNRIEIVPAPAGVKSREDVAFRMSLAAIKGVGDRPIDAILEERTANGPFASFADFLVRMTTKEREIDPGTGRTIPVAVNKTAIVGLIKVGAFDAFDDRGALMARAEAYFGTTSAKKKAAVDWTPVPMERRALTPPRDYLDWERDLLGFYVSAHPTGSIPDAAIEAALDRATAREEARAIHARNIRRGPGEARDVVRASADDCLAHETVRDENVRVLAGLITKVAWKPNKSGVGGKFGGLIEDETEAAPFTYWQPRDTDTKEAQAEFAAFRDALLTLVGSAVIFVGEFSTHEKWGKGIQVSSWTPVDLPRLEVAEAPTTTKVPTITRYKAADEKEAEAALVELFGGASVTSPVENIGGASAAMNQPAAAVETLLAPPTSPAGDATPALPATPTPRPAPVAAPTAAPVSSPELFDVLDAILAQGVDASSLSFAAPIAAIRPAPATPVATTTPPRAATPADDGADGSDIDSSFIDPDEWGDAD